MEKSLRNTGSDNACVMVKIAELMKAITHGNHIKQNQHVRTSLPALDFPLLNFVQNFRVRTETYCQKLKQLPLNKKMIAPRVNVQQFLVYCTRKDF
jgi:hypothetical protein